LHVGEFCGVCAFVRVVALWVGSAGLIVALALYLESSEAFTSAGKRLAVLLKDSELSSFSRNTKELLFTLRFRYGIDDILMMILRLVV